MGFVRGWQDLIERHRRSLELSLSALLVLTMAVPIVVAARRETLANTSSAPKLQRGNLLPNPGFETDVRYWGSYTLVPVSRTTTVRWAGDAAGRVTAAGPAAAPYGAYTIGVGEPVAGDRYTFSIWVKGTRATIGKPATIALEAGGEGGGEIVASNSAILTGSWQLLSASGVVRRPARTAVIVRVFMSQTVALGDTVFLDRATVSRSVDPSGSAASA